MPISGAPSPVKLITFRRRIEQLEDSNDLLRALLNQAHAARREAESRAENLVLTLGQCMAEKRIMDQQVAFLQDQLQVLSQALTRRLAALPLPQAMKPRAAAPPMDINAPPYIPFHLLDAADDVDSAGMSEFEGEVDMLSLNSADYVNDRN